MGEMETRPDHYKTCTEDAAHTLGRRAAADAAPSTRVAGLEAEEFFADEFVDLALEFLDPSENVLGGTGVVDRGSQEPDEADRNGREKDELRGAREDRQAAEEGADAGYGYGNATIERRQTQRDERV